jgi:hypothetical protein
MTVNVHNQKRILVKEEWGLHLVVSATRLNIVIKTDLEQTGSGPTRDDYTELFCISTQSGYYAESSALLPSV